MIIHIFNIYIFLLFIYLFYYFYIQNGQNCHTVTDELMNSLCVLNLELFPKQGTTFGMKDAGWL